MINTNDIQQKNMGFGWKRPWGRRRFTVSPELPYYPGGSTKKRSSSNHSISQGMIKLQWGVEIIDLDIFRCWFWFYGHSWKTFQSNRFVVEEPILELGDWRLLETLLFPIATMSRFLVPMTQVFFQSKAGLGWRIWTIFRLQCLKGHFQDSY